jgi:predicted AAA+ superfamily ATPase
MINRKFDKQNIIKKLINNPSVAILGPRQVGKTTIAKEIAKEINKKAIYLDLESLEDFRKISQDTENYLTFYKDHLIILDEVQILPQLFSVLRSLVDKDRQNTRFLLLGSASPSLIKGVSESLSGRISYYELMPLNLWDVGMQNLNKHWSIGGFPLAYQANENINNEWLQDFVFSYTNRELNYIFGYEINNRIATRLWEISAHSSGSILNSSDFSRVIGVSIKTINRYLDFLEGAYLIKRLNPWYANVGKRLSKMPKLYLKDTGVMHHLLGIKNFDDLINYIKIGNSWETYVINQISSRINNQFELYYYRTYNGAEMDLVIVKSGKPFIGIEIKYSNSPVVSKGFYSSISDLNTKHNFVVTPNSDYYPLNNVFVVSLWKFIEEIIPILE